MQSLIEIIIIIATTPTTTVCAPVWRNMKRMKWEWTRDMNCLRRTCSAGAFSWGTTSCSIDKGEGESESSALRCLHCWFDASSLLPPTVHQWHWLLERASTDNVHLFIVPFRSLSYTALHKYGDWFHFYLSENVSFPPSAVYCSPCLLTPTCLKLNCINTTWTLAKKCKHIFHFICCTHIFPFRQHFSKV